MIDKLTPHADEIKERFKWQEWFFNTSFFLIWWIIIYCWIKAKWILSTLLESRRKKTEEREIAKLDGFMHDILVICENQKSRKDIIILISSLIKELKYEELFNKYWLTAETFYQELYFENDSVGNFNPFVSRLGWRNSK